MPTDSKEKPKDDRVRVTVHPSIVEKIEKVLPEHQKGRPFSFVVDDLLGEYLKLRVDSTNTLSGPPGHYSYSRNNSSLEEFRNKDIDFNPPLTEQFTCHDPSLLVAEEKKLNDELEARYENEQIDETGYKNHQEWLEVQKKLLKKDSPAFKVFWETYQSAGKKVLSQSKTKARTAWKEAIKSEKPEQLIEAAKRCVIEQNRKIGCDEWVSDLPDAYRWLRDEKYTVFLEDHIATQPERIIPGVTVL